ncbi:unnamed protein product [Caenorhabditis bovis]|uniref:Uncharacterized protein n=1 Tax=Caenorhabditis bovis TaxID=2654633 RepID=A0A8S1FEK0_9PELO|nr:unnamed protein product [Caenorhabditis bovis]
MWVEIRKLYDQIAQFENFDDDDATNDLIANIEKYKFRLANVLCNNPKSTQSRAKVVPNATVQFDDAEITLDAQICAEALIVSDIFTINELDAVDFVLAGEAQNIHFDGLNRGLIAVVCYYDAHRLLITSLRKILEFDREELPQKLLDLIDSTFIQETVFKHLFHLLAKFSVQSEFSRLMQPNVNGLGGSKHQRLLRNAIEEIRHEMMNTISLICENPGLQVVNISNYLFQIVKNVPAEKLNLNNLTAWLSLVKITSSDVLNQVPDATSVLNSMIGHIRDETTWSDQAMCGTIQLACAVSLKALASSPADHLGIESIKVDVERIIDRGIRNMAFQYLRHAIIHSDFFNEAYQFVIIDEVLKQLVAFFPAKLMETERNSADELAWFDEQQQRSVDVAASAEVTAQSSKQIAQNLEQPQYETAASHYENFLRCFVDLYEILPLTEPPNCSREKKLYNQIIECSLAFSTERSIELCRLLERARLPHHVVHAVAYFELTAAVCRNPYTAAFLFDIFNRDHPGTDLFGWESFMSALRSYDRLFREQKANMHRSFAQQHTLANRTQSENVIIPAQELSGLIACLRIATKVARYNDVAALRFSEDRSWGALDLIASIASASVPLQLKAALIGLLNAIARLKSSAIRVWHVMHIHQLCYVTENGSLMGMQQELDERECVTKQYDVSLSFVRLISTLLKHKNLPQDSAASIQFVTKSILSQFSSRSYNDVNQMWHLAEESLRATNTLLEYGIVEPRAVAANEIHIALLTQCLNDTPLFRSITRIIMEDCQAQMDPYSSKQPKSSESALIALKILSRAIILHPALRACARVLSCDVIVASIQSLVFTPIHSSTPFTLLDLIFHYLQTCDDYPIHALYAVRILRDVTLSRGAAQGSMLELLKSRDAAAMHVRAVRTALCATSIHYSIDDSLAKEEDDENPLTARGETARILLDTLADAVDTKSDKINDVNNICYYLLAFRPSKANTKELYENDEILTGLHYILYIIEQFISTKNPFSLSFSALLEPSFRFLQRLVSMSCPFAKPVLCFMRSSNIIEKLVTSEFVCSALIKEDEIANTYSAGVFSVRRMIVGYILHFAAVEISAMLTTGHFTRPETLYRALLETSEMVSEYTMDDEDSGGSTNLLFSLLRRATVTKTSELIYPELVHFNVNKLHEIFDACLTITIYGVPQYDTVYLDRLLRREIETVYADCEEYKYVQKEVESVLEYSAEINANLLSKGSSERIVSGCTALLNVFSVFAPVHFFTTATQLVIFRDSCYVLIEMVSGIDENGGNGGETRQRRISKGKYGTFHCTVI